MDLNTNQTISYWTHSNSLDTLEEFGGSLHLCSRLHENPTNTLYMLYPNGPSQKYPYPAEYTPYTHLEEVSLPAESGANYPASDVPEIQDTTKVSMKARRPYVRRKKDSESQKKGSSEHPSRKASTSTRQVASPRKPASLQKLASPRKPASQTKVSSVPNVSSPLRKEISLGRQSALKID